MTISARMVLLDADELRAIVRDAVADALRAAKPQASEYLDLQETADLLGVTKTTVRTYVRREALPVHRLGARTLRFARVELERWMVERASRPGGRADATRGKVVRLHGLEPKGR
jgi:excisionase family DNA binding protein